MKKAIVISLVGLLLNSANVFTQTSPAATGKDFTAVYDARVNQTLEMFPDLPGIAIVIIKDDKPIFLRAYGMADREAAIKSDTDTLYYIASSTKSFTALVGAMLDNEDKIKLSDPLTKYTPGIRFKNEIPEKVTIRDLLTHTSGLRNGALVNRLAFTGQIDQGEIDQVFANGTSFSEADFGKYKNDLLGTIEIIAMENALAVRMGNVKTVATPFTQSDTIRVVMLPGGNGEVIGFGKDAGDKIGSLNFGGTTFTRVTR